MHIAKKCKPSEMFFGHVKRLRCNDPCRLHINHLSIHSKATYDWNSWSNQSVYMEGNLIGGQVCRMHITLGYCTLIPILLNWLFVLKVWSSDLQNNTTSRRTFIFGVTATYPIFLVLKYLSAWKNKEQMKQQKERFEREVATAEGYLESILQVGNYLYTIFVYFISIQPLLAVQHLHMLYFTVPHLICPHYVNLIFFPYKCTWGAYIDRRHECQHRSYNFLSH